MKLSRTIKDSFALSAVRGCLGAFLAIEITWQVLIFISLPTTNQSGGGTVGHILGGWIMMTLNSLFFSVGYAPFWIPAGIFAAWLVPRIAAGQPVARARVRGLIAGGSLGVLFTLVFASVITYDFHAEHQYRSSSDLIFRFRESALSGLPATAIIVYALWIMLWAQSIARRTQAPAIVR